MSYDALRHVGITFRPIDQWPGEPTKYRTRSQFSAPLAATARLVASEVRALSGKHVVLQLAITEDELRIDGLPYASAKPVHPGVILAFESKHGPLKFAVDKYVSWHENLRAIALGMQALRKVDRYGVTKRGEQYTGWRALPMSTDAIEGLHTRADAVEYLSQWNGDWKRAANETHPDKGGTVDEFRKVIRAKELIAG